MAEPARQRHPELEPDIKPQLGVIEGGGESTPRTGNLSQVNPAPDLKEQEEGLKVIQGGGESTPDRGDLRSVSDQEDNPNAIPFTGGGAGSQKQSFTGKTLGFFKKNSAATGIVGLLLTGVFSLSLLSPSLLLMQFRETLVDKFNDQLTTMDLRQTAILKKKLGKTTLKGCTITSIRCKYRSLGDRHIKRLQAAGITVDGDGTTITGRTKPTTFTFEGRSIPASEMLSEARSSPALRSAMRHGYNPKFAAFSDAIASKINGKLGIKKSRTINPSSDPDKMKEDLQKSASGEAAAGEGTPRKETTKDADGNQVTNYYDADGNPINEAQYNTINNAITEIEDRSKLAGNLKSAAIKSGLKGALTSTALGLGAADSMCTAWTAIRVATFAAKIYGQRQLIRYSYEFLKAPDALRANAVEPIENQIGPEEISYLSTILTTPNSKGQTATDSDGYGYAAYGDVFSPAKFDTSVKAGELTDGAVDANLVQNETSRYVNGQIIPENAIAKMLSIIGSKDVGAADSACGVIKSWKGQAVIFTAAVAGVVVGFFTGGVSVGAGAVLQAGAMAVASVAFALLIPKLADMAKGQLITGDENGNEAGNAIVSGMGGYNAQTSQGRGLAVLDKQDAVEYAQATETTVADYNEVDRYEKGPLDPTSKNTFIGSIVNTLLPYTSKMSSGSATISSTASLVTQSIGNILTPKSKAADIKADELNSCSDPEYEGLAADPFCNLRYGLNIEALSTDPEDVLDYMIQGGYVTEESATPQGEYATYIERCIDRTTSIGDRLTEGNQGDGKECIQGKGGDNEKRNTMFRLFYIDQSIQEGMDSDFQSSVTPSGTAEEFTVGTYNLLNADLHTSDSIQIAGSSCNRSSDPTCGKARATTQAKVIMGESGKYPQMDIVGTQETSPTQYRQLLASLPGYEGVPSDEKNIQRLTQQENGAVSIVWNTSKFKKVKEGYVPALSNVATKANDGEITSPWVELESTEGNKIFAISIHYPVANYADPELGDVGTLKKAMDLTLKWVNEKAAEGTVLVMGDFNDHTDEKTTYCGFTATGLLQNSHDMSLGDNPNKPCPNPVPDFGIDHVYVSTKSSLTASSWTHLPRLKEASEQQKTENPLIYTAGDHSPMSVNLKFPGSGVSGSLQSTSYKNPVINSQAPDPSVVRDDDGTYHLYTTGGDASNPFLHFSSKNLVNWKRAGKAISNPPSWLSGMRWAPDVAKTGDHYTLTFTGGTGGCSRQIGYATAPTAAGPFTYRDVLVKSGEFALGPDGCGTIDSHIFVDGGKTYLFYGGGLISTIELSVGADGSLTKVGSLQPLVRRESSATIEGAWVHKKDDWYYLFYSYGDWSKKSGTTEYSTKVTRSKSPLGPYEEAVWPYHALLNGKDVFRAPGHNSIATDDAGQDWIVYHAYQNGGSERKVLIDKIVYVDGWPTVAGGSPSSTKQDGPQIGSATGE